MTTEQMATRAATLRALSLSKGRPRAPSEGLLRTDPVAVPWRPLLRALGAGCVGGGALLAIGLATVAALAIGLLVLLVGLGLVAGRRRSARLGWANAVTSARLVGLGWIAALTAMMAGPWSDSVRVLAIIVIALVCLALDGVDGQVARSRGEISAFGARFDMETDAAMILVLCVAVALQGSVGWWVLAIGLARYVYWLCSLRIAALNTAVAPSIVRKAVAVGQSAALVICLALGATGLGPAWLPSAIAAVALVGLGWSFASVTVQQLRTARRAATGTVQMPSLPLGRGPDPAEVRRPYGHARLVTVNVLDAGSAE
jgi:phosphatidylglycerophosphate synthase